MSNSYKRIAATKKACEILKYLGDQKGPVSALEIAESVGLALGITMCQLATLEDSGFVQAIGERYQLGNQVGLMWARIKANLEHQRETISRQIEAMEIRS